MPRPVSSTPKAPPPAAVPSASQAKGQAAGPSSTPAATAPAAAARPQMNLRIDDKQKVHLAELDSPNTRTNNKNNYVTMGADDFVSFKNGGKRTGSNKVTDPQTQKHYAYDAQTKKFYEFDKTKPGNKGAPVDASQNSALQGRLDKNELVDRSRPERNAKRDEIQPGDVGPYHKDAQPKPGTNLSHLKDARADFNMNRDHVPSGESLNRRNPGNKDPYKQGITVAIPDDNLHKPHSVTYGSRQKATDTLAGPQPTTHARVDYDAKHPASAFNRDMNHLLDKTQGQKLAQGHERADTQQKLDMTQPDSRLNMIGAYRYAGRTNVKLNENVDSGRGYDPQSPAHSAQIAQTRTSKTSANEQPDFKYTPVPGKTQGELISQDLRGRLVNEGHAQPMQDVTGGGKKRTSEAAGLDAAPPAKQPRTEP